MSKYEPIEPVITEIERERKRQDDLWGYQKVPNMVMFSILVEEIGEVAKCLNEHTNVREELVQVAAVAVKWLQLLPQ